MNKKKSVGLQFTADRCIDDRALASLEHGPDMQLAPEVADHSAAELANPFYLSEESEQEEAETPKFAQARPKHY